MSTRTSTKTTESAGPGGSTVKTTTYQTSTSYESQTPSKVYRPNVKSRTTVITRSAPGLQGGSIVSRQQQSAYGANPGLAAGALQAIASTGVSNVKTSRVNEKKDMQDLNERFASYIEKVRFLEAQNRKLADELDKLKSKWGKETTAIKAMFQAELDEARKLLDEAEKEKARLEIKVNSVEEENEELRAKLDELTDRNVYLSDQLNKVNTQLSDTEAEVNMLRRRVGGLEDEKERDKREIARLTDALNRARIDLDNETLQHIDAENRRQTLEEELEFLKSVHEQEMKELAALAYRDTTQENRDFWKNEMGNALREIQQCYDEKLDVMRGELETYYNMKIQEFRTGATRQNMENVHSKEESKRLKAQVTDLRSKLADMESRNAQLEKELELLRREYEDKEREWEAENTELKNEVAKLRAEMEAILKELQDIMDTKLGLELEIAAYRKLLEGEENRIGLRKAVGSFIQQQVEQSGDAGQVDDDSSLKVSQVVKGEMSAKTTYQRSAKGPVTISECSPDGNFITIENTGRRQEDIGNWIITRDIDGRQSEQRLPQNISLRGGNKIKLFATNYAGRKGADDIDMQCQSWGIGANITTKLCNPNHEERAAHVQKTSYSS